VLHLNQKYLFSLQEQLRGRPNIASTNISPVLTPSTSVKTPFTLLEVQSLLGGIYSAELPLSLHTYFMEDPLRYVHRLLLHQPILPCVQTFGVKLTSEHLYSIFFCIKILYVLEIIGCSF